MLWKSIAALTVLTAWDRSQLPRVQWQSRRNKCRQASILPSHSQFRTSDYHRSDKKLQMAWSKCKVSITICSRLLHIQQVCVVYRVNFASGSERDARARACMHTQMHAHYHKPVQPVGNAEGEHRWFNITKLRRDTALRHACCIPWSIRAQSQPPSVSPVANKEPRLQCRKTLNRRWRGQNWNVWQFLAGYCCMWKCIGLNFRMGHRLSLLINILLSHKSLPKSWFTKSSNRSSLSLT